MEILNHTVFNLEQTIKYRVKVPVLFENCGRNQNYKKYIPINDLTAILRLWSVSAYLENYFGTKDIIS